MDILVPCIAVGAAAGFLGGLVGIGGGLVVVPMLALVFAAKGLPAAVVMPLALGTSLASIVFTSLSSVCAHHARGAVDWTLVRRLTPGLVFGALGGAAAASCVPGAVLRVAFVGFAVIAATRMLFDRGIAPQRPLPGPAGMFVAGGLIAGVASVVGVGGASLAIPYFTARSVPVRRAIGSASAVAIPIGAAAVVGYVVAGLGAATLPRHCAGFVHLPALAAVAGTSVLAAPLGAALSHRLPVESLKKIFACLLYVVVGKMLMA